MNRRLAYSETFINLKHKLPESYIIAHPSHCAKDVFFYKTEGVIFMLQKFLLLGFFSQPRME